MDDLLYLITSIFIGISAGMSAAYEERKRRVPILSLLALIFYIIYTSYERFV